MITAAHAIIYTVDAEADRAFFRDVLKFPHMDAGQGWLIFGLPPSEVAFHPAERNGKHELYLLVDDVEAFARDMAARNVACTAIRDEGWGRVVAITLPGGGEIGVYEPRHARPGA